MPPTKDCQFGKWTPEMQTVMTAYKERVADALAAMPSAIVPFGMGVGCSYEAQQVRARVMREVLNEVIPDRERQRRLYADHIKMTDHIEEEEFLYGMQTVLKGSECIDFRGFDDWNIRRSQELYSGQPTSTLTV